MFLNYNRSIILVFALIYLTTNSACATDRIKKAVNSSLSWVAKGLSLSKSSSIESSSSSSPKTEASSQMIPNNEIVQKCLEEILKVFNGRKSSNYCITHAFFHLKNTMDSVVKNEYAGVYYFYLLECILKKPNVILRAQYKETTNAVIQNIYLEHSTSIAETDDTAIDKAEGTPTNEAEDTPIDEAEDIEYDLIRNIYSGIDKKVSLSGSSSIESSSSTSPKTEASSSLISKNEKVQNCLEEILRVFNKWEDSYSCICHAFYFLTNTMDSVTKSEYAGGYYFYLLQFILSSPNDTLRSIYKETTNAVIQNIYLEHSIPLNDTISLPMYGKKGVSMDKAGGTPMDEAEGIPTDETKSTPMDESEDTSTDDEEGTSTDEEEGASMNEADALEYGLIGKMFLLVDKEGASSPEEFCKSQYGK